LLPIFLGKNYFKEGNMLSSFINRRQTGSANPQPDFLFRLIALLGAFTLGLAGLLLILSISASLFSWTFINPGPGTFFTRAYGILAFMVPVYFFWAAWILARRTFKPGRIFILSAALFPFLTLAAGFSLIRDFEYRQSITVLQTLGRNGIGFISITLAGLECIVIMILHSYLFSPETVPGPQPGQPFPEKAQAANPGHSPVEAPAATPPAPEQTPAGTGGPIPELPAESSGIVPAKTNFKLPEWEPLATPQALRELERFDSFHAGETDESDEYELSNDENDEETDETEETLEPAEDEVLTLPSSVFTPYSQAAEGVPLYFTVGQTDTGTVTISQSEEIPGPETAAIVEKKEKTPVNPQAFALLPAKHEKPKKHTGPYSVPVDGILNQYPDGQYWIIDETTQEAARILQATLREFGIQAEVTGIRKGPVITMFEILPAPGVKLSKIVNLQDNIALRLAASSVRIVAPIPGKHAVGIEVPNKKRNIVSLREIIEGELRRDGKRQEIPVVLGKDITGEAVAIDLTMMPHLLIAGSTGSGKSVCVNVMILSILYQRHPADCKLIMIDPKIVELKLYNDIPHLLTPVITEPKKAFQALQYCIFEMERRYACLDSMGVRDIKSYNKRIKERNIAAEHMPYIVVVIDEFADLMATTGKELESTVARLAAMSRAVGIHLVLATQRPSIDVITGLIKANIPSRIAFMVASKIDSRIIIDMVGAEKLLGKGDMLYAGAVDPFPIRMQGAFVSEEEVERVVEYVKTLGEPEYIDEEMFFDDEEDPGPSLFTEGDDPLYDKALETVIQQGKASASYIQRRLKIGYNRAARLVEEMEKRGLVGPAQGSKPRELLRAYQA
jgi:S-DNA-T family DNA segregation ATPase FtsK/SpoIIIE